jgi:hypothetical protein
MTAAAPVDVPAVERQLAFDMIRRGLPLLPVLPVVFGVIAGGDGALSSAYGIAIVLANLALSALTLGWAARQSPQALMAAALVGFLLRMGLVSLAIWAVKEQSWVELVPLGITVLTTHLGLLFWETRYVSASLAFPGLKPVRR